MVNRLNVKPIDPNSSQNYLKKAIEFYDVMEISNDEKKWNAVGLNAVHCVISASDAMLAKYGSIRNTSQDHKEAADILVQAVRHPDTKQNASHLRKVLGQKNIIEYEKRLFTEKDAIEIIKPATIFFEWAKKLLA